MNWENLTAKEFKDAVRETGVCILPMGVLEKHGDHLPLGTDYLNAHRLATLASEHESAVVFPPFYFGQIFEAKCFPGTVTLKSKLLLELVQNVLDEIGRNGFKKIILFNTHGGNTSFLQFVMQCTLEEEKPYQVYLYTGDQSQAFRQRYYEIVETHVHGHACECETSISLYNHEHLVKMDQVNHETTALRRLKVSNAFTGLSWYANFPEHYAGDARVASIEKGQLLVDLEVKSLVDFIRQVKEDDVLANLSKEFFGNVRKLVEE